jgi:glycosyltransferase involved in cell wall biosynthesis
MRILYLANKPPAPVVDGGTFAMHSFLSSLSKLAHVDALILSSYKHPFTKQSEALLKPLVRELNCVDLKNQSSLTAFIRSIYSKQGFLTQRFAPARLKMRVQQVLQTNYDYVVCDHLLTASVFLGNKQPIPKLIIRTHNIESEVWQQRSVSTHSWIKKILFARFAKRLKANEIDLYRRSHAVLTLSEQDLKWIDNTSLSINALNIPVAIESTNHPVHDYSTPRFFHLGAMNWQPNVEAVQFLVNELWKNQSIAQFPLVIAGLHAESLTFSNGNPSIQIKGWVDDVEPFMRESGCLISPIFSGSGIRIKLLESMSLGVPCLTTTLGASGISVQDSGLLIADDTATFVDQILRLATDEQVRKNAGEQARVYIKQFHNEQLVIEKLTELLGKQ